MTTKQLGRRIYLGRGVSISEVDGAYSIGVGGSSFSVPLHKMKAAQAAEVEAGLIAALENRPSTLSTAAFDTQGLEIGAILTITRGPRPFGWLRRLFGSDRRAVRVTSVSASEITFDEGSSILIPSATRREQPYRFWPVRGVKHDSGK